MPRTNPPGATQLLISLCDVLASLRQTCLIRMDLLTRRMHWVDIGFDRRVVASGKGIALDDASLFHLSLVRSPEGVDDTFLTVLDRGSFDVVHRQPLPEVRDGHSLLRHEDRLYVASTGTDEVWVYRLDGVRATEPELVWTPTGSGSDTHHVNSIAMVDGELCVTAIGPKLEGTWMASRNGYIWNLTRSTELASGLWQPHSLTWHEGQFWFCNSQVGTLNAETGPLVQFTGYSRGLAFVSGGPTFIGTSVGRRPRNDPLRGHDVFHNPWTGGEPRGRCAVVMISPGGVRTEIGMTDWGSEIYDLLLV